jgi:putative nucleotidyltransferase with HDIG domain
MGIHQFDDITLTTARETMLHLRIISGSTRGRTVALTPSNLPLSIGRDPHNLIKLEHTAVSRFHCVIATQGGDYHVEDLDSTNGTYLNGRRVSRHTLNPGDELIVANVGMVVEARQEPLHREQAPLDMSVSVDRRPREDNRLTLSSAADELGGRDFIASFDEDRERRSYRALEVLHKADRALRDIEEFKGLLVNLLELTMATVPATRGYIFLVQRDTGSLVPYVRVPDSATAADGEVVVSQTILSTAVREKRAIISADALVDERFLDSRSVVDQSVRSAMCAPLVNRGKVVGVIYVDSPRESSFSPEDLALFSALALKAGVAIDNARLYDDLRNLFYNTVETLVRTIQAKDPYTCGHSTRVSRFALLIAEKLGLSTKEKHQVYLASMLHDIGKIGVPDDLLNRPGKLSEEEMEQVRNHVQLGVSMLEMLGEMHPIVPLVRHHHEAWDGSGYPDGLRAEEIPLISRIVAVADMYDAMTSDRPYRKRLSRQEAVDEIRRVAGTKIDPRVADAFLEVLGELAPPQNNELEPQLESSGQEPSST